MKKEKAIVDDVIVDILKKAILYLNNSGVECGSIKGGSYCIYCKCKLKGAKLSIVVYEAYDHCDKILIPVQCKNDFPFYRYLFRRPTEKELFSGEGLQELIKLLDKAFCDNKEIIRDGWIDKKEFWSRMSD